MCVCCLKRVVFEQGDTDKSVYSNWPYPSVEEEILFYEEWFDVELRKWPQEKFHEAFYVGHS